MDLYRLDIPTYIPDQLIEGYDSLIWTERYTQSGDFELKTPNIQETMILLPEGALVSHKDTGEVMMVESHQIAKDEEGAQILTTTGRSVETFLENRNYGLESDEVFDGAYGSRYNQSTFSIPQHIALWMYDRIVHVPILATEYPVYLRSSEEELPNVSITRSWTSTEPVVKARVDKGDLYSSVLNRLVEVDFGIRTIRPTTHDSIRILFDEGDAVTYSESGIDDDTTLRFDLYNGNDLRSNVIFDERIGDIEESTYLRTIRDYANVAFIGMSYDFYTAMSPDFALVFYKDFEVAGNGYDPSLVLSGWDRRVMYIDVSDMSGEVMPTQDMIYDRVKRELKKKALRSFFDGEVGPDPTFKYNQDYQLGDFVKRISNTGFSATARVTEYIRTEDKDGDRGYPTLVTVDDPIRAYGKRLLEPDIPGFIVW